VTRHSKCTGAKVRDRGRDYKVATSLCLLLTDVTGRHRCLSGQYHQTFYYLWTAESVDLCINKIYYSSALIEIAVSFLWLRARLVLFVTKFSFCYIINSSINLNRLALSDIVINFFSLYRQATFSRSEQCSVNSSLLPKYSSIYSTWLLWRLRYKLFMVKLHFIHLHRVSYISRLSYRKLWLNIMSNTNMKDTTQCYCIEFSSLEIFIRIFSQCQKNKTIKHQFMFVFSLISVLLLFFILVMCYRLLVGILAYFSCYEPKWCWNYVHYLFFKKIVCVYLWFCSMYTVFRKKTPTHIFFHISMNYLWI